VDVEGPVAALAELAVADDVDARLGLPAHDRVDRLLQTSLVGGFIVGLAILDLVQELDEVRGPDQAADMGCEDAVGGRCHFAPSLSVLRARLLITCYHLRTVRAARAGLGGANGRGECVWLGPAKAGTQPQPWIPAISAFTRVHSPSKTGVNALNDALCAGMNGVLPRGR